MPDPRPAATIPLTRMTDPARDDGAETVIFRCPRTLEDEAREIAGQFPGWHVWYTPESDPWNAHREAETIFRPPAVQRP